MLPLLIAHHHQPTGEALHRVRHPVPPPPHRPHRPRSPAPAQEKRLGRRLGHRVDHQATPVLGPLHPYEMRRIVIFKHHSRLWRLWCLKTCHRRLHHLRRPPARIGHGIHQRSRRTPKLHPHRPAHVLLIHHVLPIHDVHVRPPVTTPQHHGELLPAPRQPQPSHPSPGTHILHPKHELRLPNVPPARASR